MLRESALVTALAAGAVAAQRTITVRNLCDVSIWPAVLTRLGTAPNGATGWEAAPRTSLSFTAEAGWMGRIWARTACNFDGQPSASQCETGGCDSGLLCASTVSGTPASFVELTLASGTGSLANFDFYDVSLVDGFNLPITIKPLTSDGKCSSVACVADVLADCPSQLAVMKDGEVIACSSACRAGIGGNTANSTNCCTGSFNTPDTCAASQVQFYDYFHQKCPNAYAYAYDDAIGLRQCTASDTGPNYEVTFCRESDGVSSPTSTSTGTSSSDSANSQSSSPPQDSPSHSLTKTSESGASDKSTSLPPPAPANRASLAPTIAGATVGAVVVVALAGGFLFYFFRRGRRKQDLLAHPQMFQHPPPPSSSQHHTTATLATSPIPSSQHYTSTGAAVSPISSAAAQRARSPARWSLSRRSSSVRSPPPAYSTIGSYR